LTLRTRTRHWSFIATLASAAAVLASCGSSSTNSSSGGSAFDITSYKAAVAQFAGNVQWNGPTTPAKAPAAEKAFVVACTDALEGCRLVKEGVQHALTDLKWEQHTQVVDDPAAYSAAMQNALNQNATIVFLVGIQQEIVSGPLAQAHASHIPVVSVAQYNKAGPGGVDVESSPDGPTEGKAIADAMIVNNNGKVDAQFLADAEFGLPVATLAGARKELGTCAPCKIEPDINFIASEIQTALPTRVTAALQAHPNINSVLVGYDPPIAVLAPAIDNIGSGKTVKLYTQLGTSGALKFLRTNDVLIADIVEPEDWNGYAAVDEGIRLLNGMPLVQENLPIKMLTKDNVPPEGQPYTGDGVNYQSKYHALWGIA
jgi:ribose transport system substrate-binding protein